MCGKDNLWKRPPTPPRMTRGELSHHVAAFVADYDNRIRQDHVIGPLVSESSADVEAHIEAAARYWLDVLDGVGSATGLPTNLPAGLPVRAANRWIAAIAEAAHAFLPPYFLPIVCDTAGAVALEHCERPLGRTSTIGNGSTWLH